MTLLGHPPVSNKGPQAEEATDGGGDGQVGRGRSTRRPADHRAQRPHTGHRAQVSAKAPSVKANYRPGVWA